MAEEDRMGVERVSMVDLSNASQFEVLFKYFHKNFETIAFWVCHCLFPSETSQYPHKLLANAWHLADNPDGLVGGFSGTDDNQRALPLQVTQQMLSKHQRKSEVCCLLVSGLQSYQAWREHYHDPLFGNPYPPSDQPTCMRT